MATPKQQARVVVNIAKEHQAKKASVIKGLRKKGLKVGEEAFGKVFGTVAPDRVASLNEVPGVESVRPEFDFELPPKDSPVQ